jgi:hypothetical protein
MAESESPQESVVAMPDGLLVQVSPHPANALVVGFIRVGLESGPRHGT